MFGQKNSNFNKLIEETNHYLYQYSRLYPFGESYLPISSFGISKKEIRELLNEASYDATLTKNKDSIATYHMIGFIAEKIEQKIEQIAKHPGFLKNNIKLKELIKSDELSIIKSDDNKLFNFSFDEKTGGSYRSQISKMYYFDEQINKIIDVTDNPIFSDDGYFGIYNLETDEGTKYVLTGFVRGCSYCFETSVQLINSKLNEEFSYSVNNRDWNDGVIYEHETKIIYVDYHIDDLTPYCFCEGEIEENKFHYDKYAENNTSINCKCKFIFNGKTFELVEESWKRISNQQRKE